MMGGGGGGAPPPPQERYIYPCLPPTNSIPQAIPSNACDPSISLVARFPACILLLLLSVCASCASCRLAASLCVSH